MNQPYRPTHDYILALAKQHGIAGHPTEIDRMGEAITRLAGNEVIHTEAALSLAAPQARGILGEDEAGRPLDALA